MRSLGVCVCVQSGGILGDAEMRERTAEKRRSRINPSAFVKPGLQVFNNEKKRKRSVASQVKG